MYQDILKIISNIVVKRMDLAKADETTDTFKNFELYLSCVNGTRTFYDFSSFNLDILTTYLDTQLAIQCSINPNLIPDENRDEIVIAQSQYIIDNYIEENDYYRMLNGKPNYATTIADYIYITDRVDVPSDIPIHEMDDTQISHLYSDGTIDSLKTTYPNATYLNYLGSNKIDVIKARLAKPFEILRLMYSNNRDSTYTFKSEYYKARRFVMARLYHRELFTDKTLYDPIIGIIILVMAIRNSMVSSEKEYLNSEDMLNRMLESYGLLKYFESFPFTIKQRLILALDKILAIKGTDLVLVDICKLFDFTDFAVNRYYLMKTYKTDENNIPIITEDPNTTFDLEFIKVDVTSKEIDYSDVNKIPYENVTNSDPLWQLTDAEKTSLITKNFNLMMSKYIDIEAAYDVTNLTFELCCFTNLLLHSRVNLSKVDCVNKYSSTGYSNVFTMIIFWLASMSKRSNFDGNIIYSPNDLAEIMQFNYGDIDSEVQELVNKYELRIDVSEPILSDYEMELSAPIDYITSSDAIQIYVKNKDLYYAIINEMNTTEDAQKYMILYQLKQLLYTASMEEDTFKKTSGDSATTYYDMLQDLDDTLSAKLDSLTDESELNNLIIYILEKLDELFDTDALHYLFLNTPSAYGSLLNEYLETAINVFKASSVQLRAINVFFYLGDYEPLRLIDEKITHETNYIYDNACIHDEFSTEETIYIDDYIGIEDKPYIT